MDDGAVEPVGDRRARWTPAREVGAEHEVVDEQLGAPAEQVAQRGRSGRGLEAVLLLDGDPRKLLPAPGELVATAGVLLLGLEQLEAGGAAPPPPSPPVGGGDEDAPPLGGGRRTRGRPGRPGAGG